MHLDQFPGSFFGPSTLVDLLQHRAEHQAQAIGFRFLTDGEDQAVDLTYERLDRKARTIGAMLQELGLQGERALLLYPSGLEFVAAFFGCLYAGVVAVPAYPPRRNRNMARVESIARDASAKIALATHSVLDQMQTMIEPNSVLNQIPWRSTEELKLEMASDWKRPDVHGDTLAFLQYTSGSTGTPKGVMLNHANLLHNSAMINYAFEDTRSGHGVFWLPLYHDMGLIGGILQPLYLGGPNTLLSPAAFLQRPFRWLRTISRCRATISGGPNFAYDLCVDKITQEQKESLDLSSWTIAFNGAEPVRPDTMERFSAAFRECGFRREAFYPCYGLAEATLIVSGGFKAAAPVVRYFDRKALEQHQVVELLPDDDDARELVGCGSNLLDQQIVIADPETHRRHAEGRVGEIWVSGPSVAQGYWKRPEESSRAFQAQLADEESELFLRTGDLGFLLDGEVFVTGRLKDLIILRGVNHYPQDIEFTVQQAHSDLRAAAGAAFTIGEEGQEKLVVVNEASRRRDLDAADVIAAIRTAVAREHELALFAMVLVKAGSIPKTSSGKIQRHACRQGFLDGTLDVVAQWQADAVKETATHLRPSARAAPHASRHAGGAPAPLEPAAGNLIDIIYDIVRGVAKERAQQLAPETNIVELGLDSLERMEIITTLEARFGGQFPLEVMQEMQTCGEVVEAVQQYLGVEELVADSGRPEDYEPPRAFYDPAQFPEYQQLRQTMAEVAASGIPNPYFRRHERVTSDRTQIEGREYVNFCSYNYLGMSGDPTVTRAAQEAVARYGTSVSASRVVSGEKPLHGELERALADFIGIEDVVTFVGGHSTNETTIGHLLGPGDLILHDALAHNSIIQGCLLSGARRRGFAHNDFQECDEFLRRWRHEYRRVLIVIEGVYSMDGDFPQLPQFIDVKRRHGALLMVDEAHSIGTMGPHGRGMSEHFDLDPREVDIWMGTLSKSFGSCGGYIGGSRELVEYLKYTAPGFVYSVGLPPGNAGAALAALRLLEDEPQRVAKLTENAALFLQLAKERNLDTGPSQGTPVIPVIVGNSPDALSLSHHLFKLGINVQPIMHPAVEETAARLRFFLTSLHTQRQIRDAVEATATGLATIRREHLPPRPTALRRESAAPRATTGAAQ